MTRHIPKLSTYALVIAAAIIIMGLDGLVLVRHVHETDQRSAFISSQTPALGSLYTPTSPQPTAQAMAKYTVPSAAPKYLIIPRLHIDARIEQLPLNALNQLAAPNNTYDAAWYDGSSKPGKPGAMLIDGYATGVFSALDQLTPGSIIDVVRGDNHRFTYIVQQLRIYEANNVNMAQVLAPATKQPGLNIMTGAGSITQGTGQFSERLVVYAALQ
jgi:sortase (surface protein transpeptidase)